MSDIEQSKGEFLLYQTADGDIRIDTRLEDETVWLTQAQMAELFGKSKSTINEHIKNIFKEGELQESTVMKKFGISEFQQKAPNFYSLDVIISVGYRVKSMRGTQFRIWATELIREYIKKGFILDNKRLKEPEGGRYFEELLAEIRDIRSSEKIFWRKVLDIYATSIDYDPRSDDSQKFFKQVQNKMHWATHGHPAAELINGRVDADKPNMGITNYPGNKILKRDVEIAKNYLEADELTILDRIVTAYLEMAELQALSQDAMTMKDWADRLNMFLTMTGRELLDHAGKISHDQAMTKAHEEYEKFKQNQLSQPTQVELDFIKAENSFKQMKSEQ